MRLPYRSLTVIAAFGLLTFCGPVPPCHGTEPLLETDAYRVELAASRDVTYTEVRGVTVREHSLRVVDKEHGRTMVVVFGGPDKPVTGDLRNLQIFGGRLVVVTETALGVFGLSSGREERLVQCLDPEISPTGRRIAYKAFQPRFIPQEASSHVVLVLDVETLESEAVFPGPEKISEGRRGEILAWEDDPEKRLSVGKLFWGPGEEWLLLFGKRWRTPETGGRQAVDSFVMIDLRRGLDEVSFVEGEIPPEVYMKPGAEVSDSRVLFNVADVKWLDGEAFEIVPPHGYWWMKEQVTIQVPRALKNGPRNG